MNKRILILSVCLFLFLCQISFIFGVCYSLISNIGNDIVKQSQKQIIESHNITNHCLEYYDNPSSIVNGVDYGN